MKENMVLSEDGSFLFDKKALLPWDPENLIKKGGCNGACKSGEARGVMKLAALDKIDRGSDQKIWLEWLDFRDYRADKRKVVDGGTLRGIVICPGVQAPIISKWLIATCCRPSAQLLMQLRGDL
jgi:hypothetical protein